MVPCPVQVQEVDPAEGVVASRLVQLRYWEEAVLGLEEETSLGGLDSSLGNSVAEAVTEAAGHLASRKTVD